MPARMNSPPVLSPWASITMIVPSRPSGSIENTPSSTKPIWLTDEYAMIRLRFVCAVAISAP